MPRSSNRVVGWLVAALLVCAAGGPGGAAAQVGQRTEFRVARERGVAIKVKAAGKAGRMWGYWGELRKKEDIGPYGSRPYLTAARRPYGSYRATCAWLSPESWSDTASTTPRRDNRLLCTVVLSFSEANGGGDVVAVGLIRRPQPYEGLFAHASRWGVGRPPTTLAIVGASAQYFQDKLNWRVDLTNAGLIALKAPPPLIAPIPPRP